MFYQTLPDLLTKYCSEAILHGKPVSKLQHIEENYANEMLNAATKQAFLNKKGKRVFYKGKLIQITGY